LTITFLSHSSGKAYRGNRNRRFEEKSLLIVVGFTQADASETPTPKKSRKELKAKFGLPRKCLSQRTFATVNLLANQNVESLTLHLIQSGQWREAVYLVRDESGSNLSQAEAQVERLALVHGIHRYSRGFMVSIIGLIGLSLFAVGGFLHWL